MQDKVQAQKQRLDAAMFSVQIILDEMGLDEHDAVQNAFNALADELDKVTSTSY